MVYEWASGTVVRAEAQLVGGEIESIEIKTPEAIIDKARDESTELHRCFEWDDSIAAHEHRKEQARYILNHLRVIIKREDAKEPEKSAVIVKAYESVTVNNERVYMDVKKCLSDDELRSQVLARLKKQINESIKLLHDYNYLIERSVDYADELRGILQAIGT